MKKIILSAAVLLFTSVTLLAQSTVVEISSKVKVTFPLKAEKQSTPVETMKIFVTEVENEKSYMGMSMDLTSMGITGEIIATMGDGFFDQMKAGLLGKLKGAKINKEEVTKFKGKSALYLELDGAESEEKSIKGKQVCMYVFFLDATMHQVAFYGKKATKELAKDFFESVQITE